MSQPAPLASPTLEVRRDDPHQEWLQVRGAREHNLKNVSIDLPKRRLVVLTGPSGSGKSSLAFDTLYAEGQRRYVESLSAYARQFLGQMEKPQYDVIRGLSPTISIEQKVTSANPRSTVGTITEVQDYLRVLYATLGIQHCTGCGRPVGRQSAQQICTELLQLPAGTRLQLLAPLVQNRKGEHRDLIADARKRGFTRARIDGTVVSLDEAPELDKKNKHSIDIVVDRLVAGPSLGQRLADSVETGLREGQGVLGALVQLPGAASPEERLFSEHFACPSCGLSFPEVTPASFSFNTPAGMCGTCNGLGTRLDVDPQRVVPDPTRSVRAGAIHPWATAMERGDGLTFRMIESIAGALDFSLDTPWYRLPAHIQQQVLHGNPEVQVTISLGDEGKKGQWNTAMEGVIPTLWRRWKESQSEHARQGYQRYFAERPCPDCEGERLRPESRAVRVGGLSIVQLGRLPISQAASHVQHLTLTDTQRVVATELLKEISGRLRFLLDVGLGYLTLDRPAGTLSGGESQRIRLASQMGSELTGVLYILDEPSIGLHQRDNGRLLATLQRLRDLGNSVLVVEHDQETIEAADWIVDFGPGAGEHGGRAVAEGSPTQIRDNPDSLTGNFLSGRQKIEVPSRRRPGNGRTVDIVGARANNLREIDASIPLGALVAVTGVSGAGKSTLINGILRPALAARLHDAEEVPGRHRELRGVEHLDKVIDIDQRPIGRTPRSNPATYTKLFDLVREVFAQTPEARAAGYEANRFSFNVKGGRCEACQGDGSKVVEMHFLADVYVTCEVCRGRRFNDSTLQVRFKGLDIAQVLAMSVREALGHFAAHKDIVRILRTLDDVGLGYLRIGQSSPTLSGGEAQRVKLAKELARTGTGRTMYILDEPTTGLHFDDVRKLLQVLQRLVEAGNSVVVIEHNLDVIKCADHVIDIGPEGGDGGGLVVAAGTPEQVAAVEASHTGRYLRRMLD